MSVLVGVQESSARQAHDLPIQSLAFGPGGLMASGDIRGVVRFWHDTRFLFEFDLRHGLDRAKPAERIRGLAFSPTGHLLYAACGDLVRAFSMMTAQEEWRYQPPRLWGFLIVSPWGIACSPNGDLAVATDCGKLSTWTPEGALRAHWADNDAPRLLTFIDEGTVVGTDTFTACAWRTDTGRKIRKQKLSPRAFGLAATPRIVALRGLHETRLFDTDTLTEVSSLGSDWGLPLVEIEPDRDLVAVSGIDRITIYSPQGRLEQECRLARGWVRSIRFAPGGSQLTAGCSDGFIRTWDLAER